jgi:hypothetical protein
MFVENWIDRKTAFIRTILGAGEGFVNRPAGEDPASKDY